MGETDGDIQKVNENQIPIMLSGIQINTKLEANYSISWNVHAGLGGIDNVRGFSLWPCIQINGQSQPTLLGSGISSLSMTSKSRLVFSISGSYETKSTQDVVIGMCAATQGSPLDNNGRGYISYMIFG
jgi:hypothetical protein